jgi:hypothetical protein
MPRLYATRESQERVDGIVCTLTFGSSAESIAFASKDEADDSPFPANTTMGERPDR